MANYAVENQWGGSSAPWQPGGNWALGGRGNQQVVAIDIASGDGGNSFTGTMTYVGEGPIGFKAQRTSQNQYSVEVQWGGNNAPWQSDGVWVIGSRDNQNVVAMSVTSSDGGNSLSGTSTYASEGVIGFRGMLR